MTSKNTIHPPKIQGKVQLQTAPSKIIKLIVIIVGGKGVVIKGNNGWLAFSEPSLCLQIHRIDGAVWHCPLYHFLNKMKMDLYQKNREKAQNKKKSVYQ